MACAIPVIATNIGQISRIIKDRQNGILVNNNNIDEIIKSIFFLKENPDIAKRIGNGARKDIENFYNWERVADETEKILENLA